MNSSLNCSKISMPRKYYSHLFSVSHDRRDEAQNKRHRCLVSATGDDDQERKPNSLHHTQQFLD